MLTKLNTILSENLNNELCPYDSEEGSIASYYDDEYNINYIIFSLKEENIQDDPPFLIKRIINLDINNDNSPELCFVVHLQSGDTSSLDRFPITLGEGGGASIELYDTSGSQIYFFAPRKMTFLYAFDGSVIEEYTDIRDGYGIKINDGAFGSLDTVSTVFTIASPLQWSFNIFPNDITTDAPIFFVGSLSDWCGGTQDFSLFYDTYIANEALHPISSYIGVCLFGGLEFCIEIRNNYLEGGFDYQDTLLSEIILSGEFLEEIFRRDPATWVGSLSFYNSFEGSEEYPEEKIKIVITSDYLDNEPEYQKIKRLFTELESVKYSPFGVDSIYSLYLDSYTTLSNWISVNHRPQDLWWPISDNSYSYSQFLYIRDEEGGLVEDKKISLEDIHDYVTAGRIGECAFAGITFEDSTLDLITSNVSEIKSSAFEKCVTYGALRIDIPQNIILESNSLNFYSSIRNLFFSGSPQDWRAFYLNQFSLALGPFSSAGKHYFSLYCNNVLLTTFGEQEFYLNKDMIIEEGVFYHVSSLRTVYLSERAQFKKDSFRVYEGLSTDIKEIYSRLTLQKWQALSYQIPAGAASIYLYSKSKPSKEDFSSGYNFYTFEETTETEGFALSSDKNKNMIDSKYFQVDHDGKIYAENAEISGHIHANSLTLDENFKISRDDIEPSDVEASFIVDTNDGIISMDSRSLFLEGQDLMINSPHLQLNWEGNWENGEKTNDGQDSPGYFAIDTDNFKVDSDGKITAAKGEIAGWTISRTLGSSGKDMGLYSVRKDANNNILNSTGMANVSEEGGYAFWAGCDKENPWQEGAKAAFYVTNEGKMVATKGNIGNCIIDSNGSIRTANNSFKISGLTGLLSAEDADISGTIKANKGKIGGWQIGDSFLTNYSGTQDANGYYPNSFCMQTQVPGDYAVNALAIGKCSPETWGQAGFRVTVDGQLYAVNGKIGSCKFQSEKYPVVGEDLANPTYHKLNVVREGEIFGKDIPYLDYYVRFSPADEYSQKTFEPYSVETNSLIEGVQYIYYWYYNWTDSPDTPPSSWKSSEIYFSRMDTSIIETYPYLWLRCLAAKRTGPESDELIDTIVYYIGDFSGYLTTFNIGGGSLNIGSNIITGKTSSIKFESDKGRLSGTWYYGNSEIITESWRGVKSNIEGVDDRYTILFDELQPVRFTYNNGQSHRYHTGLILDELKKAMDKAGIDTSEFAAYCISNEATGEGGIRYGEFISLCIDQIQKLKKRVEELENNKES